MKPSNTHTASNLIKTQLYLYKVKAVKVRLLKGFLLWLSLTVGMFLVFMLSEWAANLSVGFRTFFFILFTLVSTGSFVFLTGLPAFQLITGKLLINDKEAAKKIGSYFPSVRDKLLNYLELTEKDYHENSLAMASLHQRSQSMQSISFPEAIDANESKKPVKYLIPVVIILLMFAGIAPKAFISSTQRVIHFRKSFVPKAPFQFTVQSPLHTYKNEQYQFKVTLSGEALPDKVWLVEGTNRIELVKAGINNFEFSFPQIVTNKTFYLEAAGYKSQSYTLEVINRPAMNELQAQLKYPAYVGKKPEIVKPAGELVVPEGTTVTWNLQTQYTEQLRFYLNKDTITLQPLQPNTFKITKAIATSGFYGFQLEAPLAQQKGKIEYSITAIKDQYPTIQVKSFTDTLLYSTITVGGEISDDYGLTGMWLYYQKDGQPMKTIKLPMAKNSQTQQVYFVWPLDTLQLSPGSELSFYLQVADNDGVNGNKYNKSQRMYFRKPAKKEIDKKIADAHNTEKATLNKTHTKASSLKQKIDETLRELKSEKELNWQDKQNIKELLTEKEKLNQQIEEHKKQNNLLNEQRNKLQNPSPELRQKAEQLQQLMNDLLDDETKQLYEELQKLLQEQAKSDDIQTVLNEIRNKELNLAEELARTLELFKRMQVEQNLEKLTQDLKELANKQDSLAKETRNKQNNPEDLTKEQEKIADVFKQLQEKLDETKELNNELKRPNTFDKTAGEEDAIDKEINEAKENLNKNNRKKSSQNQKNAGQKMRSLGKKLENMQAGMQMEQMQEDVNNLRAILANLITLSYNQEQVMVDFRKVNQSDPRFVTLSEQQLKLQDDSKIIKDSLLALAGRVMAISSFVTRELNEMEQQLTKSAEAIKERKKGQAGTYQQLSMTSMNNLALMLDNVLQQMQESMADAMGKGKGQKEQPMPGMSELQKQLNQEIRELQKSGKSGKELSEELAKLAAKQEMIRKALREAEEKLGDNPLDKEGGTKPGNLGNLQKQMEQTELDLVNKNLSRDLQRRQEQILTRLLQAEKALREQEMDTKRESKTAVQYEKQVPRAFEEYLQQKQKEIELIKTIPPKLHPYYKKEVNEYFNRIKTNN